eukprot:COSAG02_NODE_3313_length_6953_cov_95.249635_8_plen_106_part_00
MENVFGPRVSSCSRTAIIQTPGLGYDTQETVVWRPLRGILRCGCVETMHNGIVVSKILIKSQMYLYIAHAHQLVSSHKSPMSNASSRVGSVTGSELGLGETAILS